MAIDDSFIRALKALFRPEQILSDECACYVYGYDNSRHQASPELVIFPDNSQQICQLVCLCRKQNIPIYPRGTGTGTQGGSVPFLGGIVLCFSRMNRILSVDAANRVMVVEPGVTNQEVQQAASEAGFFWAPDPSSSAYCTVGGNLAYNSAGPRAVKYGTPRENTLGLSAVTGAGEFIKTGVYTTKGVVGYDLTRLIIGSEGTLAIITEANLKLLPKPAIKRTVRAVYDSAQSAALAISQIMAQPVTPCALEFMDYNAIALIRNYSKADLPNDAGAILMIDIDGSESFIQHDIDAIANSAKTSGLVSIDLATSQIEAKALWETRKALSPAQRKVAPKKINEDIVVPVANIPKLIAGIDDLSQRFKIHIVNFGHAGNGNLHVNLLINPDNPSEMANADICLDELFSLVLNLNGTLSGEHGIGYDKRNFIDRELDPASIHLMRTIKSAFDPDNILNPGKMFPDEKTN